MSEKNYDVVVFGATGFTGALVAKHFSRGSREYRWAIAGRSRAKLEALQNQLPHPPDGIIEADVADQESLVSMATQARVVLSTVGPFVKYGEPVVKACIDGGADYVDITGEPEFVDSIVVKYDERARQAGLRIVSCCGFDSVPHDLGALFTVQQFDGDAPIELRAFVHATGSISGGTWNSALGAFARIPENRAARRARLAHEQRTAPTSRRIGNVPLRVYFEEAVGAWACPLPTIDPEIVMRSARRIDAYGPDFRYGHYARTRSLPKIVGGIAGIAGLIAVAQIPPARRWLQSLRSPGEGPSEERRRRAQFTVTFIGKSKGREVVTEVSGGDGGYEETAKMVAESALCLALDRELLPGPTGVITPAVAMGNVLIERLHREGIRFRILRGGKRAETSEAKCPMHAS